MPLHRLPVHHRGRDQRRRADAGHQGGGRPVTATQPTTGRTGSGAPPIRDHSATRTWVGQSIRRVEDPKFLLGSVRYRVRAALTNKNQQGAYRGFGSEVNNWMLEQMVDKAARELGLDPVAVRRMNFIRDFPHFIPTGNVYDSGDYERVLDHALELARYDHWRAEQQRLREQEGRHIGIGVITAQERSVFSATEFWFWFDEPGAPVTSTPESVSLKVDATGGVSATLYSCAFWGNSPETMVAQLVAEQLDVDPTTVNVVYGGSNTGVPAT